MSGVEPLNSVALMLGTTAETRDQYGLVVITEGRTWGPTRWSDSSREAVEAEQDRLFSHLMPGGLYNGGRFLDAFVVHRTVTTFEPVESPWAPVDPQIEWPVARVIPPGSGDGHD